MLNVATVAYVAGIIDTLGVIRTRMAQDTELPYVGLSGSNERMLRFLGDLTGTRVTVTRRSYMKAGCAEHCGEKHQLIQSVSGRWVGLRAEGHGATPLRPSMPRCRSATNVTIACWDGVPEALPGNQVPPNCPRVSFSL